MKRKHEYRIEHAGAEVLVTERNNPTYKRIAQASLRLHRTTHKSFPEVVASISIDELLDPPPADGDAHPFASFELTPGACEALAVALQLIAEEARARDGRPGLPPRPAV